MLVRLRILSAPLLVAVLTVSTGCRGMWREPSRTPFLALMPPIAEPCDPAAVADDFAASASRAELIGSANSTDDYCQATLAAWSALQQSTPGSEQFEAAYQTYHDSLARFLTTARDNDRFLAGQGIALETVGAQPLVPIATRGAVWRAEDIQAISPVGDYRQHALSRQYKSPGWGVPVVVERHSATLTRREEQFLSPGMMFAATALLRPSPAGGAVLELYDPLHPATPASVQPLAADLSAPFALRLITSPDIQSNWLTYFGWDMPSREGLFFLEPYQPGKTPVILVHGILANPVVWVDMANDLRAVPGFAQRYQLWGFRYSTGMPFLESAARLRRDLYRAVATVDPAQCDPALSQMVLVGHSMGGLICELQAASSGDRLWNAVANRPLSTIVMTEETRRELQEMFYFEPQPNVRTLISLAAPHEGSPWAQRPIAQVGSLIARRDPARNERHAQLLRDNPGVFSDELADHVPTSVEMLNPDSQILKAIQSLPKSPCVDLHTLIGYGKPTLIVGPGDGVVPIESGLSANAESQLGVDARHNTIHRKLESVDEIIRILNAHAATIP